VTSEKHLSLSHAGFWNALLPMAESFIRARNLSLQRFDNPIASTTAPSEHGVINEVAFRIFAACVQLALPPEDLPSDVVHRCTRDALEHIRRFRQFSRSPVAHATGEGLREAKLLATRLTTFFQSRQTKVLHARPFFAGCGWLDEAEGDVIEDATLFEIKAGERLFRTTDIRQVLCYCALNFSSKTYDLERIGLANPRLGVYLVEELEILCQKIAGTSAVNVLSEIVHYVSEPLGRYKTG
jgi:hypothetical protein